MSRTIRKICPNCGHEVDVDVEREICPECGAHIPIPPHEKHGTIPPHPPKPEPIPSHIEKEIIRRLDRIIEKLPEPPRKEEVEPHVLIIQKLDELKQRLPEPPKPDAPEPHELIINKLEEIVQKLPAPPTPDEPQPHELLIKKLEEILNEIREIKKQLAK